MEKFQVLVNIVYTKRRQIRLVHNDHVYTLLDDTIFVIEKLKGHLLNKTPFCSPPLISDTNLCKTDSKPT